MSLGFGSSKYDLSTTDATVVCEPPAVNGVVNRVVYKWRPGTPLLSDPRIQWDAVNSLLAFTLSSTDTAGMVAGHWDIYLLAGEPATVQDDALMYDLYLHDARGGPMPVTP